MAYYEYEAVNGAGIWHRYPLLTDDFRSWLPIFTVAVAISIVGNMIMIIVDTYNVRQVVNIINNIFGIAAVATLLSLFPFDFSFKKPVIFDLLFGR